MKKSTVGLITTAVVGGLGLTYAVSDKKMRNKITKDGKKFFNKASNLISKSDLI